MSPFIQIFLCHLLEKALGSGIQRCGEGFAVPSWGAPKASGLTTLLLSPCPFPGPPWYLCTPFGRMMSSILRFLTQTPGSISVSSPSRRSWAFLLASSGAADSSRPTPGACCPWPGPSPPWVSVHLLGRKLQSVVRAEEPPLHLCLPSPFSGAPHPGAPAPGPLQGGS